MRANQFSFAFGIFALVVGAILDIYGLFDQFMSLNSAQEVLVGSFILAIGLAFLSIPNRLERYIVQGIIGIGVFYYFYIQNNNVWIALIVAVILVALLEYGLKHR
ncbi:hypothetical protein FEZ41_11905 [Lentilactobacillus parafarraginis]|jgi:hypothetical protein|uniref:Uncharacterized protein n=2 Tax=Lentilactobacillus parafarraginis TaxID=390842 RepID=A0A0R1YHF3_9LACO|nr:hypothetical protein [Lentilactobacillus parafarraginis]KRM41831.1 hypothetical protein FD47_GL002174 [Lentilactobacillus parafarraginis DSM 18390 = JCM 14109]TLQ17093.1 hypothetical protein FEZ41_11905 [Lentilactobacillus parafarraginis]